MSAYLKEIELVRKGNFHPVYLLYGEEHFLIDFFIRTITESFKREKSGGSTLFLGVEQKDGEFIRSLFSISMFEPSKIIVYKGIASLSRNYRKDLIKYIQNPNHENILVLTQSEYVRKNTFFQNIQTHSYMIRTDPPAERELSQYIRHYVTNRKCRIEDKAIRDLIEMVGNSLSRAYNELDKLLLYIGYEGTIEEKHVQDLVLISKEFNMNSLHKSLGNGDLAGSIRVALHLLNHGSSIQYILSSLTFFFQNLWIYNREDKDISKLNRFERMQFSQLKPYIKRYPSEKIGAVFQFLQDADYDSKTTGKKPENILVPLLFKIVNA